MSTSSSFSEKAAPEPEWLKRLIHTFQTIETGDGGDDLRAKMKKIEGELNKVKNLFSAFKGREQKLLHHFADLNFHLREVAEYGNISVMLDIFNSNMKIIEESAFSPRVTTAGSDVILEGELPELLKHLKDTITKNIGHLKHDPLSMKFRETEDRLNNITTRFHIVKQWELELLHRFKDLDHSLGNLDSRRTIDCIHESIRVMECFPGEPKERMDGRVADETNSEKALSYLQRRMQHTILNKNAEKQLIANLMWFEVELNNSRGHFMRVKEWEQEAVKQLADLDSFLGRFGVPNIESSIERSMEELNKVLSLLKQVSSTEHEVQTQKTPTNHPEPQVSFLWKISRADRDEAMNTATMIFLGSDPCNSQLQLRYCLTFLTFFPENAVIKKRPLIYLWLGEGVIPTEDAGEEIFEELLNVNLIIPYGSDKSPVVNEIQIHPDIHSTLISLSKNVELFNFDSREIVFYNEGSGPASAGTVVGKGVKSGNTRMIFNVDDRYFSSDEWKKWLANWKHLVVLQLGRWHGSRDYHIHFRSDAILKGLGTQKHLKYLSLRGIFGITKLPDSIFQLTSLEILDLKACSNLETLPPGIASLKKLTHLDISECYLLGSMPEGLHKLSSLQVLKGFVIGYSKNNHTPCRIADLASFQKLKRLSICIGNDSVIEDKELESLKFLVSLRRLKIAWDIISPERVDQIVKQRVTFPPSLEKLDLEGIPHGTMPEWLKPSDLMELKKLYIRGGKLSSLEHGESQTFNVEILILEYLKYLQIELRQLQGMFPLLSYVEANHLGGKRVRFEWRKGYQEVSTSQEEP